jgi:DNA-binding transcriptional regulator YiaG
MFHVPGLDSSENHDYTAWIAMTGKQLKKIRSQLGLTQLQLAKELGVTSNTVARWERDEVAIREPNARLLQTIYSQRKRKR